MHFVNYEDLKQSPGEVVQGIMSFLNLRKDPGDPQASLRVRPVRSCSASMHAGGRATEIACDTLALPLSSQHAKRPLPEDYFAELHLHAYSQRKHVFVVVLVSITEIVQMCGSTGFHVQLVEPNEYEVSRQAHAAVHLTCFVLPLQEVHHKGADTRLARRQHAANEDLSSGLIQRAVRVLEPHVQALYKVTGKNYGWNLSTLH